MEIFLKQIFLYSFDHKVYVSYLDQASPNIHIVCHTWCYRWYRLNKKIMYRDRFAFCVSFSFIPWHRHPWTKYYFLWLYAISVSPSDDITSYTHPKPYILSDTLMDVSNSCGRVTEMMWGFCNGSNNGNGGSVCCVRYSFRRGVSYSIPLKYQATHRDTGPIPMPIIMHTNVYISVATLILCYINHKSFKGIIDALEFSFRFILHGSAENCRSTRTPRYPNRWLSF